MPYEISALNGPVAISHDTEQGRRDDGGRRRRPSKPALPSQTAPAPAPASPTDDGIDRPAIGTRIDVRA